MKKSVRKMVATIILLCLCVTGCSNAKGDKEYTEEELQSMGYRLKSVGSTEGMVVIAYDVETKVMYAVSNGDFNSGNVTLLVDAEGNPLLYDEE